MPSALLGPLFTDARNRVSTVNTAATADEYWLGAQASDRNLYIQFGICVCMCGVYVCVCCVFMCVCVYLCECVVHVCA